MMPNYTSNAEWPDGTSSVIDYHEEEGQAELACSKLNSDGMFCAGKIFPVRTWVEEIPEDEEEA
jgi:hypothetical protein